MASGDISFRSCKGKISNMESLPDDIVFNILVCVPAQDIYKTTRLVCRKWYKMIHTHNFVLAHDLQHSTCGLLVWSMVSIAKQPAFVAFRNGQVEVSTIDIPRKVFSSTNGLILEPHSGFQDLCIMNPATKQRLTLPPFLEHTCLQGTIAYDATSKVYKVVHIFYKFRNILECAIFTVGVDKDWTRRVDIKDLPLKAKENLLLDDPLATDGFIHWCKYGGIREKGETEHVLTLNVETEVITQFPVPVCDAARLRYYYLPIGRALCLMIERNGVFWEVWEMNTESGEWTMLITINLEAHKREFDWVCPRSRLMPVGWLKFREVLIFSVCKHKHLDVWVPTPYTIAYNCLTGNIISSFKLDSGFSDFHVHRNSLVWVG